MRTSTARTYVLPIWVRFDRGAGEAMAIQGASIGTAGRFSTRYGPSNQPPGSVEEQSGPRMISPSMKSPPAAPQIHPDVRIGHVHLRVANLDRALRFYCGVLGFELMQRFDSSAAFVSAGGYHPHIGLNT